MTIYKLNIHVCPHTEYSKSMPSVLRHLACKNCIVICLEQGQMICSAYGPATQHLLLHKNPECFTTFAQVVLKKWL